MQLHAEESIVYRGHPCWRSIMAFYLKGTLIAVVLGVIAYFINGLGTGLLVIAIVVALTAVVGFVKRIATTYFITSQRLHIRRGIIARRTQEARLERVQNVNTSQSVIERALQVGTVDFDTAGTGDADFSFAGVDDPEDIVHMVELAQREGGISPHPL